MRLSGRVIVFGALGITSALIAPYVISQLRTGYDAVVRAPVTASIEKVGPSSAYPEVNRTPGALNPDVNQANLQETICSHEWSTKSIRPPSSYTSRLKREQMRDWGLIGGAHDYEEDHFIPLELGGSPSDPRNLWPELYARPGAKEKDLVENYLHNRVCKNVMALEDAQKAIVTDWYKIYLDIQQ
jgi:hypothetical protein